MFAPSTSDQYWCVVTMCDGVLANFSDSALTLSVSLTSHLLKEIAVFLTQENKLIAIYMTFFERRKIQP